MHLYRVIVLVLLACSRVVGAAERPPNIVLIISDDQAWTDFGFMGHDAIVESEVFEWVQQLLT